MSIDPGSESSALVVYTKGKILYKAKAPNAEVNTLIKTYPADILAMELIKSYGMPVGDSVFHTCIWIGRFLAAWESGVNKDRQSVLIPRKTVAGHVCGSARANDKAIRHALLDLMGSAGTKANPGTLYGVRNDMWSALALAVTVDDLYCEALS